ncbi:putative polycystic kidney disease 2 [Paratrimastix pyriformis]|uniref:Polycystic kidney disease 2 n=1 Tax=Paratrimastix pyriformis TaxID=342808 RepID=A0ABQ8UG74_9EUKA|nr:putative polycystic kidney disease 2 [Paratrimastix pyriformis]
MNVLADRFVQNPLQQAAGPQQQANPSAVQDNARYFIRKVQEGAAAKKIPSDLDAVMNTPVSMKFALNQYSNRLRNKETYRGLLLYSVFLILFVAIYFTGLKIESCNSLRSALQTALYSPEYSHETRFESISSIGDFWGFIQSVLYPTLYEKNSYTGEALPPELQWFVTSYNRLVGGVRLRQLRVEPNATCSVHQEYRTTGTATCYGEYFEYAEDQRPFGEGGKYTWSSTATTGERGSIGSLSSYSGSGYVVDLPMNDSQAQGLIDTLMADQWLDRATRAIYVNFAIFNVNLNMFVSAQLLVEFGQTGYVTSRGSFRGLSLSRYATGGEIALGVFEIIFCLFVAYYIVQEGIEWFGIFRNERLEGHGVLRAALFYFTDPWNLLDCVNLALFVVLIVLRIEFLVNPARASFNASHTSYVPLEPIAYAFYQEVNVASFTVMLTFLKIFKFLRINNRLNLIWKTLTYALADLVAFLVMFAIIFLGFSVWGFLLYGRELSRFSLFGTAMVSCLQMAIGQADYDSMVQVNRYITPVYFFSYVILINFTLINMFLAILNDSFAQASKAARAAAASNKTWAKRIQRGLHSRVLEFFSVFTSVRRRKARQQHAAGEPVPLSEPEILRRLQLAAKDGEQDRELPIRTLVGLLGKDLPERQQYKLARFFRDRMRTDQGGDADAQVALLVDLVQEQSRMLRLLSARLGVSTPAASPSPPPLGASTSSVAMPQAVEMQPIPNQSLPSPSVGRALAGFAGGAARQ